MEFTTPVPNPVMHESLANIFIMSKAWCEKNNSVRPQDFRAKEETFASRNAMGSGPYILVAWESGVKTGLQEEPGLVGAQGRALRGQRRRVEYRPIANQATRMAALALGRARLRPRSPGAGHPEAARGEGVFKVWEGNEVRVIFFGFDTHRPSSSTAT
jgi:peptide/nickel transport system substrate-binding protein